MAKITKIGSGLLTKHPNGIEVGYTREIKGRFLPVVVGESYVFGRLTTSVVTEILEISEDLVIFRTKNSMYMVKN